MIEVLSIQLLVHDVAKLFNRLLILFILNTILQLFMLYVPIKNLIYDDDYADAYKSVCNPFAYKFINFCLFLQAVVSSQRQPSCCPGRVHVI